MIQVTMFICCSPGPSLSVVKLESAADLSLGELKREAAKLVKSWGIWGMLFHNRDYMILKKSVAVGELQKAVALGESE